MNAVITLPRENVLSNKRRDGSGQTAFEKRTEEEGVGGAKWGLNKGVETLGKGGAMEAREYSISRRLCQIVSLAREISVL